jgi:hypothetical protein
MEVALPSCAEHLPAHQRRLEAVCRIAMGEPNILGMLIGGSFASGEADIYSDLDMQFVFEEEAGKATAEVLRRMAEARDRRWRPSSRSMWACLIC